MTGSDQPSAAKKPRMETAPPSDAPSSSSVISPSTGRQPTERKSARGRGRGRGRGRDRGDRRQAERAPGAMRAVGWTAEEQQAKREGAGDEAAKERRPKRKVALYLGYCGLAYSGLQINPGVKTIEGTLFDALVKAECISQDNSDDPAKVGLHRAARTDAGVHAAINLLSLKLILDPSSKAPETSIEDHINAHLPDDLRVWRVIRVQNSFNPRTLCDCRTYRYTFPTHMLLPPRPETAMACKFDGWRADDEAADTYWKSTAQDDEGDPEDLTRRRPYRVNPATLDRFATIAQLYLGTHNFHNFTIGTAFSDRSSVRIMKSLEVKPPFVADQVEWLSLEINGQSFMLHQIRKMVGLLILMTRSPAPPSLLPELFGPTRVTIPKAPALGLRLERPHFDRYNRRLDDLDGTPAPGSERKEALDYPDDLLERVEVWARGKIEPAMRDDGVFAHWLRKQDEDVGDELDYLGPLGIIPSDYKAKTMTRRPVAAETAVAAVATAGSDDEDGRGDAADLEG